MCGSECKKSAARTQLYVYRSLNREKYRARWRAWFAKNHDKKLKATAKWRAANSDKVRAYGASEKHRKATDKWKAANPDKVRGYYRKWLANNPGAASAASIAWQRANPQKTKEIKQRQYAKARKAQFLRSLTKLTRR